MKEVCRKKAISPICTCFFGLRSDYASGNSLWIIQTKKVVDVRQEKKKKFYFRLQFKVMSSQELKKMDNNAYLYYLKQVMTLYQILGGFKFCLINDQIPVQSIQTISRYCRTEHILAGEEVYHYL